MTSDIININGKTIVVVGAIIILIIIGFIVINKLPIATSSSNNEIPEECRLPDGQDVEDWKEHLGHHSETQECLKYFP